MSSQQQMWFIRLDVDLQKNSIQLMHSGVLSAPNSERMSVSLRCQEKNPDRFTLSICKEVMVAKAEKQRLWNKASALLQVLIWTCSQLAYYPCIFVTYCPHRWYRCLLWISTAEVFLRVKGQHHLQVFIQGPASIEYITAHCVQTHGQRVKNG